MRRGKRWRETVTAWLALPPDALQAVSRLTCIGGQEVVVEHARCLSKVTDAEVVMELPEGWVHLHGRGFVVKLLAAGEIHVAGDVERIEWRRPGLGPEQRGGPA
ncbi:MAG: hypothetical protein K6T26_02765 [Alicyclobacillus sp.]|nr:hypothetical protein [Alicyclobacillus sp.]